MINLGDSIGTLVKKDLCKKITHDHKPGDEDERKKLESKGAHIFEKKKVFRINGELAVARSFGDKNYKQFISCEPEIIKISLNLGDCNQYLILGTDGFYNVENI